MTESTQCNSTKEIDVVEGGIVILMCNLEQGHKGKHKSNTTWSDPE